MYTPLQTSHDARTQRAHRALEGLSVGDALGNLVRFHNQLPHERPTLHEMPPPIWQWTDDTNTAASVFAVLSKHGGLNSDDLAQSLVAHYDKELHYDRSMHHVLKAISVGERWQDVARAQFDGQGSYGNGAAMRAAPIGAYFADDMQTVLNCAHSSAIVTHTHPEGIAGAVVVAVAAALACEYRAYEERPTRDDFFAGLLDYAPRGKIRAKLKQARTFDEETLPREAAKALGIGKRLTAMDTVPFALWCAVTYIDNYEEAIWQVTAYGGATDTLAAICGGVVGCFTDDIPRHWLRARAALPVWAVGGL